ncbi:MAG: succinate-semialdehyde dehydrogenase (NADP(+)) [Austwickia sp.]|nr:succinate-semialdehyde dehydrogenase (NADP(+)) [Austwickia sp.]MBK9100317.1 succinate-semialdehyde dehydrogenase (NADP(+)) [Austwickia sp.]
MTAPTLESNEPGSGPITAPTALDPEWVRRLCLQAVASPRAQRHLTQTPLTGNPLADIPLSTPEDVDIALSGARMAQRSWAYLPVESRAAILLRFHDLVLAHQRELLDLIQLESGKARLHAFEEVIDTCNVARHYGIRARSYLRPRRRPGAVPGLTKVVEHRRPKGIVGIVSPWNYPLSMGITDALPALVAGNAVVLRPDLQTPLTALLAAELLQRAGLPQRVLQVVLGPGSTIGAAVLAGADAICFTGSTPTGRRVGAAAGERLQSMSLELGGKNAMYVADDADLDRAVEGAVRACFSSAGQLCVAIERLILHRDIAQAFLARFIPAVQALRLGPNLTYDADLGSLVSGDQLSIVSRHVQDARARGAQVLTGGRHRPDLGPYFYEPTVLDGVTADMEVYRTETFGPVVSAYRVGGDAEAIRMANDSEYGLNASVWTADLTRGRRIAGLIQAGTVNVNEGYAAAYGSSAAPMGGYKASGVGRRHGDDGILKYTQAQTVAVQRGMGLGVPPGLPPQRYAALVSGGLKVMRAMRRG